MNLHDRTALRDLAKRVADIAELPVQAERRQVWQLHNDLKTKQPMILVFPEGSWEELLPDSALRCEGEAARKIEWQLRSRLYCRDHLQDDTVIEKIWTVNKVIHRAGWGLEPKRIPSPERRGAWLFDPVIHEPADMKKLRFPEVTYDGTATAQALAAAQDLFGDILDVRLKGVAHVSFHLMSLYTDLRGLEQVMMDMVLNPSWLRDAMAFLVEGHRRLVQQFIDPNCCRSTTTIRITAPVGTGTPMTFRQQALTRTGCARSVCGPAPGPRSWPRSRPRCTLSSRSTTRRNYWRPSA